MKLPGFPEKLSEFLNTRRQVPHRWGTNDCVTFTADGVLAVTGYDFLAVWRSTTQWTNEEGASWHTATWTNEEEANAALANSGGLIAGMDSHYVRVEPAMAQRGDACLVKDGNGLPSLALVVGSHAAAPGPDGTLLTPMNEARIAWRT